MTDEEIECPACGHVFYPGCDTAPLDAEDDDERLLEDAAERLLENYTGHKPSAGEVGRLKERISEILVSEFGISAGLLP